MGEQTNKLAREVNVDQPCWAYIKEVNSLTKERLESVAVRDGYHAYTYRQMFRQWERYAEAFSSVGLTAENHSRVALIGTPTAEVIFAFYGLNMTGASVSNIYHLDLYDENQISSMIEREGITDLIVSEIWAFPRLMKRLLRKRKKYGLRHIIMLSSPMGGDYAVPALEAVRKMNSILFRELKGGLVMDDLLEKYEGMPISYGSEKSSEGSVILHTTGTVNGMHKPVPMSDKALNSFIPIAIEAMETYDDFKGLPEHPVSCLTLNMSWVYAFADMLHMPLGLGMELICVPWGGTNPRYGEAIEEYGFNVLFTSMNILDSWLKTMPEMDLSSVKVVFMGGTYVSPEYKQKFNDYLRSCGSDARVINGYGLSELGGACVISPSSRNDDAIGWALPGYKIKLYDEYEDCYYDLSDGPHTGVLLISSDTMSSGKLDDTTFFELVNIDGVDYFDTNDLVRVNDDGSMTCIGRSNQFFINNAGVRFDAGLVQTAVTAQPGIVACGLAPEFHKTLHDNVPVLYVETDKESGPGELAVIHQALVQAFIKEDTISDTNLPSQVVIVEKIPLNTGGKVDAKRLASGAVKGDRYSVKPVKSPNGEVIDVMLVPATEGENALMGAGIPEELEHDAYNIMAEIFAIIPDINKGRYGKILRIPGLRELVKDLTGFDIRNISGSMMSMSPKMLNIAFRKYVKPIMKGEKKMSKKKKKFKMAAPAFPFMPFFGATKSDWDWDWGWDASDIESNWNKAIDRQKSAFDSAKEQFDQFFEYRADFMDDLADALPEDLPWAPSWAKTPNEIRKEMKDWEETAKQYFTEIADSASDLFFEGEEKTREQVVDAKKRAKKNKKKNKKKKKSKAIEENEIIQVEAEVIEEAPVEEEKPAEKPAAKPAARRTTARKTTASKAAASKPAEETK